MLAVPLTSAIAHEVWMGVYMQGVKIGYSNYKVSEGGSLASAASSSSSLSVIDTSMLGAGLRMEIATSAEYDEDGKPLILNFVTESAGRTNTVVARFGETTIEVEASFDGRTSTKTLDIPTDAPITDDATNMLLQSELPEPGTRWEVYSFDSNALVLHKVGIVFVGETTIELGDAEMEVLEVRIEDPRATTTLYLDSEGEMVLGRGPMGMELRIEPREVAMNIGGGSGQVDLALSSSIRPNRPIQNYRSIARLDLRVEGVDLSQAPSDEHQTITKDGDAWIVRVHPAAADASASERISVTGAQKPEWTQAESRVPSDTEKFKSLASDIIGAETNTVAAADMLREYVFSTVKANAGIGVMRDADEILESREGVCRDHAVLLATLTRAAGIPTRFATGLTYGQGLFFYHMWVEVWDGSNWVAMDSTISASQVPAVHIKTRSGKLEETMYSFLIDGARITLID